jgi:hypothetical protein
LIGVVIIFPVASIGMAIIFLRVVLMGPATATIGITPRISLEVTIAIIPRISSAL